MGCYHKDRLIPTAHKRLQVAPPVFVRHNYRCAGITIPGFGKIGPRVSEEFSGNERGGGGGGGGGTQTKT